MGGLWLVFLLFFGVPCCRGASSIELSYECGEHSMQLLVVGSRLPHTVLFKIFDEFGNLFEVKDCSECHHFLTRLGNTTFIFSTGYHGCHVLHKARSFQLKVRVELVTASQEVTYSEDVAMVCPKPDSRSDAKVTQPPTVIDVWKTPKPFRRLFVSRPVRSYVRRCQVSPGNILCGHAGISRESCHNVGCCYNPSDLAMPCYYGNEATAQCTSDGSFLVVISRDMLDFPILLDTVHFLDSSPACRPSVKTDAFLLFRFPLTRCGATFRLVGDKLVYETTLSSSIHVQDGPDGSITRDVAFTLTVRCSYSASDFLPLKVEVFTPPPFPAVSEAGPLHFEMRIARDAQYSSYYTEAEYPVSKVLREPVYMEVQILHRTDPHLVLVLQQCWAAPTSNPMQRPQWPILVDGCPFSGDNYRTLPLTVGPALPFPSHHQRFSVATFAFLDATQQKALGGQVYFFCSVATCSVMEPCMPGCHNSRQRRFLRWSPQLLNESLDLVSSPGSVIFQESEINSERAQEKGFLHHSQVDHTIFWTLIAAFVAVAIFSVAALWYRCKQSLI
ncbi:zona pellucida sperm-binding protein 1 isoform X2 [Rhinatrema bivittatum]|uniref:zona pellucida sperm-binding protein 1 isoform X2 n=1 Tax=Rhinatrema bivittatum TaxID=194408 RepID=UPI001127FA1C|nr:zona pellucida sperm-binding protein 1 isoform X2 [Rhinatrema bivittatum]